MSPLRSSPDGEPSGPESAPFESWDRPRTAWLLPGRCRNPRRRTLMLEVTARALFPTILVFSIYLLCVGHYGPGGGFSAGLVAGLAFVLRYLAGGSTDPGALITIRPPVLMGVGLTIAVLTALAPVPFGAPVLSSAKFAVPLGPLGELEIVDEPVPRRRGVPADRRRGARPAARARLGHRARHAGRGGADMTPGDLVAAPTVNLVMALTVGVLYTVGFYLMLQRSLMRVLLGVVVLGHGTNLLLQLVGGPPARVPIVGNSPPETFADPLPQALALTAVVITFALTTFLLALGYRSFTLIGHDEVQDDVEDRRIARIRHPAASLETGDDRRRRPGRRTGRRAMTALPTLPVLLPILGAALTVVVGTSVAAQRVIAVTTLGAVAAVAAVLLVTADRTGPVVAALGGWAAPVGIALVADRLSALLLLVSTLVALAVLVYAISQRIADYGRRMASSTFYPMYLVLSRRGLAGLPVGRPVHAVRLVRDHADGVVRADHPSHHHADDPGRDDVRDRQPAVVAAVPDGGGRWCTRRRRR